MYYLNRKKWNY